MRILSAPEIKQADQKTIEIQKISSLDLMERAAVACTKRIAKLLHHETPIVVFCGKGNNGGDGLAIARLLKNQNYRVTAYLIQYTETISQDAETNLSLLKKEHPELLKEVKDEAEIKNDFSEDTVCIDALLGIGINKQTEGLLADVISFINRTFSRIISIDMPSGLFADKSGRENKSIVNSSLCLTFHSPKLAFLLPENEKFVPEFEIVDIHLNIPDDKSSTGKNHYLTKDEIKTLIKKRNKFSHKGSFGNALLIAGSKGKSGAAIITAKACLRSGAGLLTVHSTADTIQGVLNHLPEAMASEDPSNNFIAEINSPEKFSAVGFGPGTGTADETQQVLKKLLNYYQGKLVIDADGLNILAENKTWLSFLPANTILTPHPKEFERLTEKTNDDFERLQILKQFSLKNNCIVILKGAHSAIAMPDGNVFFNSSGNAGLAKGGSGDGLTGIILGLLARGYNAPQAALIGAFIHGYAADLWTRKKSQESMLISDVIEMLPRAFKQLEAP